MTTLCRIVLTVVTCTTNPDLPKPSPEEAVAILAAGGRQFFVPEVTPPWERYGGDDNYARAVDRDEVFVGFAPNFASSGEASARRLDGTLMDDPPAVYGALPFHGYGRHGVYGGNNAIVPGHYYGPPRLGAHERFHDSSDRVSRAAPERPERSPRPQVRPVVRGEGLPAGIGGVRVRR